MTAPAPSNPTLREQVARVLLKVAEPNTAWENIENINGGSRVNAYLIPADALIPLFDSVIAEAEQRGAAKGWDQCEAALTQHDHYIFDGVESTYPLNPYTSTPETEK